VKAGWNGGYGRMVEVDHGGGYTTRYAHMSKILVEVGQEVKVGDQLGLSGSSGRSTGPHLHYEVRKDGQPLNPLRFIKAGREVSKLM
jgi:murein DD-endopeptidase MepM/ murein hydrolase activator NlpD